MAKKGSERRRHPRLPVKNSEVVGWRFSLLGSVDEAKGRIRGRIEDVSEGGLCIRSSQPLTVSFPIKCNLSLAGSPVSVPTILKVQWTKKTAAEIRRYRSGLSFLV